MANGRDRTRSSYSGVQRASHWGIAVLCVAEFPTASAIQRAHLGHAFGIKPPELDLLLGAAHEWIGWAVLLLTLLLLASRVFGGAPSLPDGMRWWQRWLAYIGHAAIYLGLVALIASGVASTYVGGRFAFLHIPLSKIGIALIAIHVIAVAWHQLVRRDGLLRRMLPAGSSDR